MTIYAQLMVIIISPLIPFLFVLTSSFFNHYLRIVSLSRWIIHEIYIINIINCRLNLLSFFSQKDQAQNATHSVKYMLPQIDYICLLLLLLEKLIINKHSEKDFFRVFRLRQIIKWKNNVKEKKRFELIKLFILF